MRKHLIALSLLALACGRHPDANPRPSIPRATNRDDSPLSLRRLDTTDIFKPLYDNPTFAAARRSGGRTFMSE